MSFLIRLEDVSINYGLRITRQTPNHRGAWGDLTFTTDPVDSCDGVLVIGRPYRDIKTSCPKDNLWLLGSEPMLPRFKWREASYKYFKHIYHTEESEQKSVKENHLCLAWHVNKTYDFLSNLDKGETQKQNRISFITSNKSHLSGHRKRLQFLYDLQKISKDEIDFFGNNPGSERIPDKFDGLYPYKYSIAIENAEMNNYWTEKLIDCFLSWTMPFYFGSPNIYDHFPEGSLILIDPSKPGEAHETMMRAIKDDLWKQNLHKLEEARKLVLNKYQIFPFFHSDFLKQRSDQKRSEIFIPKNLPPWEDSLYSMKRIKFTLQKKLGIIE